MRYSAWIFCALVLTLSATRPCPGELLDVLTVPGIATDLSPPGIGPTDNRLGGFGSDLYYDRHSNVYYSVTDRGPGDGTFAYTPRIQQFTLGVNPASGRLGEFQLQATLKLRTGDGLLPYDGRDPLTLHGDPSVIGRSFDPEGLVVAPDGRFYLADEYGPALYEFERSGPNEARFRRALPVPGVFSPRDSLGQINYLADRTTTPALISGRQVNRGFEGLAITPDGTALLAAMQDPLANEGSDGQGRRGRNVRLARFDVATGQPTGQFIYQLENIADINARIPGTAADFTANQQGRQIGISAMVALNEHEYLVLERDTRGLTPETLLNQDPVALAVGTKRIYHVDLRGATDASGISLQNTNNLPAGVNPVAKTLLVDIQAELTGAGLAIPERMEGLVVGPRLADGRYALLVITDNDFSIFQIGNQLFDVYTDGTSALAGSDPMGRMHFPTYIYAFAADLPTYVAPVPEPSAGWLLLSAAAVFGLRRLRGRVCRI